jgi:DNA-binding MarR family transcriptional regulator
MSKTKERAERLLKISPKIMMSFSRMHSSKKSEMTFNQYQSLILINEFKSCSVNQLAKKLRLAQSTTSQLVDRLVNAKLVIRDINPQNRRSMIISLSEEGEKMMRNRFAIIRQGYEKFLNMLDEEDQAKFEEALITIYRIAEKIETLYQR